MRIRLLSLAAVLGVIALFVAACGVPKSSKFQSIPLGNIPEGLTETTTTTTIPATTSTLEAVSTTTTIAPVPTTNPTEPATLYFVAGQQLTSSVQFLPRPVQVAQALLALKKGPDNAAVGLRTAIPKGSSFNTSKYRGVLTVDLNPEFFDNMSSPADERLAVGQIVETLAGLAGVSLIRFTMSNEPISVQLGDGTLSEPGVPLVVEDYESLLADAPPPTSTTTPATSTTIPNAPANDVPSQTTVLSG